MFTRASSGRCGLLARVYAGAHYPGDVVVGLLFVAIDATAGIPLVDRFLTPLVTRLLATTFGRWLVGLVRDPSATIGTA
jgi:membrane-associated phospholipid phosphatase